MLCSRAHADAFYAVVPYFSNFSCESCLFKVRGWRSRTGATYDAGVRILASGQYALTRAARVVEQGFPGLRVARAYQPSFTWHNMTLTT